MFICSHSFAIPSVFIFSTILIIAKRIVGILLTSVRFSSIDILITAWILGRFKYYNQICIKWTLSGNEVRYLYNYSYTKTRWCENLFSEIISLVRHWVLVSETQRTNEHHSNKKLKLNSAWENPFIFRPNVIDLSLATICGSHITLVTGFDHKKCDRKRQREVSSERSISSILLTCTFQNKKERKYKYKAQLWGSTKMNLQTFV